MEYIYCLIQLAREFELWLLYTGKLLYAEIQLCIVIKCNFVC